MYLTVSSCNTQEAIQTVEDVIELRMLQQSKAVQARGKSMPCTLFNPRVVGKYSLVPPHQRQGFIH